MAICCMSEVEKEALRRSKQIDRQLAQEKKSLKQEIKILLLGAGESGKSTFLKQMRIIHGNDYSEQDRLDFRPTIYHNILKGVKILVEARKRLQIPLENPNNEEFGKQIASYHRDHELMPEEFHPYVPALASLWKDSGIQVTVKRSNEFQFVSNMTLPPIYEAKEGEGAMNTCPITFYSYPLFFFSQTCLFSLLLISMYLLSCWKAGKSKNCAARLFYLP